MHALTATGTLTRFALRRDRVSTTIWTLSLGLMAVYPTIALQTVYPTAADRQARAALMTNPAAIMMTGPGYGLHDYTIGAINANEMLLWLMLAAAIMNILLITKHTRAEEESGRTELVRAGVVGRHAGVTAGLLAAVTANVAVTVLAALGLLAAGFDARDSLLYAAALGVTGMVFAAVSALAAQLTEHARAGTGIAMAVLGAAILADGIGNVQATHGNWVSWLSPLAWAQQTRSFVDARWWPLLISAAAIVVLVGFAYLLSSRRDVGAGLLPARIGRSHASAMLGSPLGLALRLQRGLLLSWAAAIILTGLAMGSLVGSVQDMLNENKDLASKMSTLAGPGTTSAVDGFVSVMLLFIALLAGIFAVSSTLRLRSEEISGHAEPLLATGTGRWRWMGQGLIVSVVGAAVLLMLGGLGLAVTASADLGTSSEFGRVLQAASAYIVPEVFLCALVAALFGIRSALAPLAWVVVVYAGVVGMLGGLMNLPTWSQKLSPFHAVPQLPAPEPNFGPLIGIAVATIVLLMLGLALFRRRDAALS